VKGSQKNCTAQGIKKKNCLRKADCLLLSTYISVSVCTGSYLKDQLVHNYFKTSQTP